MQPLIELAERRIAPDWLIRRGIRRLLQQRLHQLESAGAGNPAEQTRRFARDMAAAPLVVASGEANQQHYEVPTPFFSHVLGTRMKYSCGLWPEGVDSLDASEAAMLDATCLRAGIEDGMTILDLGCGWGSLSLWVAERYPNCRLRAVSNSATQRARIEEVCRERGFTNFRVTTCNVADFVPEERFDRVVSVEMFEHIRNYDELLRRIAGWLTPEGQLFVHIFCHADQPYFFEAETTGDWMARHFFTGGVMPSRGLLRQFPHRMRVVEQWTVSGTHYQRTSEAWLAKLDSNREAVERALASSGDRVPAGRLAQRWRMFFMACAELFGADLGTQWHVEHYLMEPHST